MTYEEAKEIFETLEVQVPLGCSRDFQVVRELAIEALEKQIPKKPVDYEECGVERYKTGRCSCCGEFVIQHYKHCPKCGQIIDWSE